jgi:hypothetical protein
MSRKEGVLLSRALDITLALPRDWLLENFPQWPNQACFDTCVEIYHDFSLALKGILDRRHLRMVHGAFDVHRDGTGTGHVWLAWGDFIVDPTSGQFGLMSMVILPQSSASRLYIKDKRKR